LFVAGIELTIMDRGFVPRNTQQERLACLLSNLDAPNA